MGAGAAPATRTPAAAAEPPPLPLARWGGIVGLLLAEYLTVSLFFDATSLRQWVSWLGWLGEAGTMALAVLTAALVLVGTFRPAELAQLRARVAPLPRLSRWMAAHVALLVAFFIVSRAVLPAGALASAAHPRILGAVWVALLAAVLLTALASAIPARAVAPIVRLGAAPAAAALAAGALAWSAARATGALLWPVLSRITLKAAAALLAPFAGADLYEDPVRRYLGIGAFVVEVSDTCSGIQGMGLIAVLGAAYVIRFRGTLRVGRALAIVPLGVAAAYLANVLRIAALILIGARVSPDVALGGFHSKAGWLLSCALALGLLVLVRRSRVFVRAGAAGDTAAAHENPTIPYLGPLMIHIALLLLAGAAGPSPGWLALLRIALVTAALVWLAPRRWWRAAVRWRPAPLPVLLGIAVLPIGLLLAPEHGPSAAPGPEGGAIGLFARVLALGLVAPLTEELAFRGFLLRRLLRADFDRVGYAEAARRPLPLLVSCVLCAALHGSATFWAALIAGLAYGLALLPRGRLADAIAAHATTNLLLIGYAVAASRWDVLG